MYSLSYPNISYRKANFKYYVLCKYGNTIHIMYLFLLLAMNVPIKKNTFIKKEDKKAYI